MFEGNNYSEEWQKEAEKRGLPNVKTTPLALDALITEKASKLFEHNNVYTHGELHARHEIELEKYVKMVQIEARIMGELCSSHILPSAIKYQNTLIQNINGLREVGLPESSYANQKQILGRLSEHINAVADMVSRMIEARKECNVIEDTRERAVQYCAKVKEPFFDQIRISG